MSWLRSSPLRTSFSKQRSRDSPPKDADPSACYDSFCKHSQQIYEIILHSLPPKGIPSQDDVLGVVNHVDQMVTLLILELRDSNSYNYYQQGNTATHSPCLEYLLSENLLVKLYDWSIHTGRFNNAVRLEQIKLYELLVSHSGTLLAHEPVTRPLLRLLEECANDVMPLEVEKKLVVLLNQLCVALMQNMALLDLFFHPTATAKNKFIIFNLLIPHVHREGGIGQQARDAMLLCMSLSKKNDKVGLYIADHSNICPVLATGLSGLYSLLPRKLDIETDDWHQLTPDDVNDLPALTQLMNSLEFCNAVAQVAHPMIEKQLLEFLYQGFLIPVMGPALLQDSLGLTIEQLDAQQHWVLASLKHKIDQFLSKHNNVDLLVEQARSFLIGRENKLVNARKNVIEAAAQSSSIKRHSLAGESFSRGEPKRRSLTSSFTQMFKRSSGSLGPSLTISTSQPSSISEDQLQIVGSGYRYTKTSWESPTEVSPVQNVVLCAVILDEWLKELAAITQEHAIMSLTDKNRFKS